MKSINNLKQMLRGNTNTDILKNQKEERITQGLYDFLHKYPSHLCYNRLPLLANIIYDINYQGTGVVPQYNTRKIYREYLPGDIVFVKTEYLDVFIKIDSIRVPVTLVTGVSDASPSLENYTKIISNPNIIKWIGTNILYSHPKIVKMLIGVGEPESFNSNHSELLILHNNRIPYEQKINEICIPYHSLTYSPRSQLKNTIPKLDFKDYMTEISKYRFVYCKRGSGIDTHRFSEILLMGSVPVVEQSGLDDLYSQFPCIFSGKDIDTFVWDETKYQHFLDMFWLRDNIRNYLSI
jgi:hypothetical protein